MAESPVEVANQLDERQFLDAGSVMKLLKISRTTLYVLTERAENPLPSVRMGKCRRFPFDKLKSWMENLGK